MFIFIPPNFLHAIQIGLSMLLKNETNSLMLRTCKCTVSLGIIDDTKIVINNMKVLITHWKLIIYFFKHELLKLMIFNV